MRKLLFFRSKLAAWLVGITAMVAVPVVGAVAIAYTILPDIGVFSRGQKAVLWAYGSLCLLAVVYAFVATWALLEEIWRKYLPDYKRMKYYIGLIVLPVIGSFFMLYLCLKPSRKAGGTAKWLCAALTVSTIVDVIILTIVFFARLGLDWILLIAGLIGIFNYILLIAAAFKMMKEPVGRPAKVVITVLLVSLFCVLGFMASSRSIMDAKITEAKDDLQDIFGRYLTSSWVKLLYYHGMDSNYKKFEKIMPRDPDDKDHLITRCKFPPELECYYQYPMLDNKELRLKLHEWLNSEAAFFKEFDRTIDGDEYLKMPESFRNYDGMVLAISLSELNSVRHWARLDCARITDALNNGNVNRALQYLKQMKRIRNYAGDDYFVISILVSIAVESIRIEALGNIIEKAELTEDQIYDIISELDQFKWYQLYDKGLYSDAVYFVDTAEYLIEDLDNEFCHFDKIKEFSFMNGEVIEKYFNQNKKVFRFLTAPFSWIWNQDFLYGLKLHNIQSTQKPPPDFSKMVNNMPSGAVLSRMIYPVGYPLWKKVKMIRSQQEAAITGLRIELYRRKYNKLPEKLDDLIPEFALEIPVDPFDGKSLKYIHGDITLLVIDARVKYSDKAGKVPVRLNGYRVYSIGPDEKDDHGFYGQMGKKYYDDIGFSVIRKVIQ